MQRRLTRLATSGLAAHVFFELAAGVEMPLASFLRPGRAAAFWAASTGTVWHQAGRRSSRVDPLFSAVNGLGLAAVAGHLLAWPAQRTRLGLPWLESCEGMGPEAMLIYNPILYGSALAATAGLLRENRSAPPWVPMACLAMAPVLAASQRGEVARLREQARTRPGWWNRRLRSSRRDDALVPGSART